MTATVRVRAYERRKPHADKQDALHRRLAMEVEAMRLSTAPAPRADDPYRELRAQFSHLPPMTAGRAMAAKIVADTKADLIDMEALEKGIHEAMDDDPFLEFPELDDMEFRLTGGFPL